MKLFNLIIFNNINCILFNEIFYSLAKISVFKYKDINICFLSVFDLFILNKKYNCVWKLSDCLTFNYFNNKSFIFLNFLIIKIKSKLKKKKIFLYFSMTIIHCYLHSQGFRDNKEKLNNILILLQNKLLIKFGFKILF